MKKYKGLFIPELETELTEKPEGLQHLQCASCFNAECVRFYNEDNPEEEEINISCAECIYDGKNFETFVDWVNENDKDDPLFDSAGYKDRLEDK